MTVETFENSIRSRFMEQVEIPQSIPVQYDNMKFDPPTNEVWARVTIVDGETRQIEIGGAATNRERTVGVLMVQVFAPIGSGTKRTAQIVDTIRAAFKRVSAGDVHFRTPSHNRIGKRPQSRWWQENVRCPYFVDA